MSLPTDPNSMKPNGYNVTAGGRGHLNYPHTPETRAKISAANKKLGNHRKGKKHSPETKLKISLKLKGHDIPPEVREKISKTLTGRKGKSPTDETRKKISEAIKKHWEKRRLRKLQKDNQ